MPVITALVCPELDVILFPASVDHALGASLIVARFVVTPTLLQIRPLPFSFEEITVHIFKTGPHQESRPEPLPR